MDGISWVNALMRVASIPNYNEDKEQGEGEIDIENIHKYITAS